MIHFSAKWADQCQQMNTMLEEMSHLEKYGDGDKYAWIEAEEVAEVSLSCDITAAPTILFYKNGKIIDKVEGAKIAEVQDKVQLHFVDKSSLKSSDLPKEEKLEDKLRRLINKAPCVLFMKGSPEQPRCGFSRTITNLLNEMNASYETFDILQDNTVREGLKKFSDWPTYPQLYIDGKLIGGLDIVQQMKESGELEEMLTKKV